MADVKITGLPELSTTAGEDLLATVDDPSGTPVTKKITRTNFLSGVVSDAAYAAGWNGVTDVAPSKNAVYDRIEADSGDVVGPATHAADYVPQWNSTPNSKTLVEGFEVTDAGKAILDDADAAAQRTTLGCPTDPAVDTAGLRTLGTGALQALPGNSDAVVKAWISFNGIGVIAINDSFNVSSITDGGTGDYAITWDTNFANTNYCVTGLCGIDLQGENMSTQALSVDAVQIHTNNFSGGATADSSIVCVIAIGDQ